MQAVNVPDRLYMAPDGEIYPITMFLDYLGEECDPDEAIVAIAGAGDRWFPVDLVQFDAMPS